MRACGTRYGFISTYNETVYLKIVTYSDGTCALLRSKCYSAEATAIYDQDEKRLSSMSVRLGILYLIHKISHGPESVWAIEPGRIDVKTWVEEDTSPEPGDLAEVYGTPYTEK